MTAARILQLNGDLHDSPMMEVVRRFHALSTARDLPYCVIGGMAVIRSGYPRTTTDVDVLTSKDRWLKVLPLEGDISSEGIDSCRDDRTGARIDVLFFEEDRGMPMAMPDPATVGEFDEELGANFIGLHALVQLKAAVYLTKLSEDGEDVASKDRSDVFELISRNLPRFSAEVLHTYHPAVREHCMRAFASAARADRKRRRRPRDADR